MKDFQFPEKFVWEQETYKSNYGKLVVEPLIKGYGITVGNALRRVLLSSLWGAAITSIKIDGVFHEFTKFEGIKEDMVEVLMNLKQVRLKTDISEFPYKINVQIEKSGPVLASDLIAGSNLEVLNKNLHIMTLTENKKLSIDMEITEGRGYVSSENIKRGKGSSMPIGTMVIDGIYSPVLKATYNIENVLYKTSHDYEKLTLEVFTTGAITPMDAVKEATGIINKHFKAIEEKQAVGVKESKKDKADVKSGIMDDDIHISEFKFSTRVSNGLKKLKVSTLNDLLQISREELEKIKNFGKKSIEEIDSILAERGYKLKSEQDSGKEAKNET